KCWNLVNQFLEKAKNIYGLVKLPWFLSYSKIRDNLSALARRERRSDSNVIHASLDAMAGISIQLGQIGIAAQTENQIYRMDMGSQREEDVPASGQVDSLSQIAERPQKETGRPSESISSSVGYNSG